MSVNRCTFNFSSVFTINSQSKGMTPPGCEPQTVMMAVTSSTRINEAPTRIFSNDKMSSFLVLLPVLLPRGLRSASLLTAARGDGVVFVP